MTTVHPIHVIIAAFLMWVLASNVEARTAFQDGSKSFKVGEVCLKPSKAVEVALNAYGERPILEWSFGNLPHFLFYNAEKEAWTIFVRVKNPESNKEVLCVISEGLKMRPTTPSRVLPGDEM